MNINIASSIFQAYTSLNKNYQASNYNHKCTDGIGHDTANFDIPMTENDTRSWLNYAPGMDVEAVFSGVKWRGFVNSFTVNLGRFSITKGPLVEVANRVYVKYDGGMTDAAENVASQELYGIRPIILTASTSVLLAAEKNRDWYLEQNRLPKATPLVTQEGSGIGVTFECLGYAYLLKYPYYNDAGGLTTAGEKILNILLNEPNGVLQLNYDMLEANTLSEYVNELEYPEGLSIIQGILAKGADSSDNRMSFGVDGLTPYYQEIENKVFYTYSSLSGLISSIESPIVEAHDLKAGRWLTVSEFSVSDDVLSDIGSVFIESVTYTYPKGWSISGNKNTTLKQRLAKMGLGGY